MTAVFSAYLFQFPANEIVQTSGDIAGRQRKSTTLSTGSPSYIHDTYILHLIYKVMYGVLHLCLKYFQNEIKIETPQYP